MSDTEWRSFKRNTQKRDQHRAPQSEYGMGGALFADESGKCDRWDGNNIFTRDFFARRKDRRDRGIRAKRRGGCHNTHAARGTLFLLPEGKDVGPVRDSPMRLRACTPPRIRTRFREIKIALSGRDSSLTRFMILIRFSPPRVGERERDLGFLPSPVSPES